MPRKLEFTEDMIFLKVRIQLQRTEYTLAGLSRKGLDSCILKSDAKSLGQLKNQDRGLLGTPPPKPPSRPEPLRNFICYDQESACLMGKLQR